VDDEVLARLAPLVGVVLARIDERLLDPLAVDRDGGLVGVLLDDREQVREQPLLDRRQLGAFDRALRRAAADAIDRRPGRRDQRRGAALLAAGFALLRNRLPSSYRLA
jgi:hypothetical protein